MELTPGQLKAARARGCVLAPATDDQVRRLSMQRRILRIDGLPFVAARDGFFETHGTLAALIEMHFLGAATDWCVEAAATPIPTPVLPSDPEASTTAPSPSGTAGGQHHGTGASPAKSRKARASRPKPPPAATEAAVTAATTAEEKAEGTTAELGAAPTRAATGRMAGRRAGEPPKPRWVTAGKARRGRLK